MYFDVFMYVCIHSFFYLHWHIQVLIEILIFLHHMFFSPLSKIKWE
jgi:hypothetical protein